MSNIFSSVFFSGAILISAAIPASVAHASESQPSCSENWKDFYWAEMHSKEKLFIKCMADNKLVVAPKWAVDSTSSEKHVYYSLKWTPGEQIYPPPKNMGSKEQGTLRGELSAIPFNFNSFFARVAEQHKKSNKPLVVFEEKMLHGFERNGNFWLWPSYWSEAKILEQQGPLFSCRKDEARKDLICVSALFKISETNTVVVELRKSPQDTLDTAKHGAEIYHQFRAHFMSFRRPIEIDNELED